MSYVSVYKINTNFELVRIAQVQNARWFYLDIWDELKKRHFCSTEEQLWAKIGEIPRLEGLAMAATFDRCWCPVSTLDEMIHALQRMGEYAPSAAGVAHVLNNLDTEGVVGVAFDSSLSDIWKCSKGDHEADDWYHQFDAAADQCKRCEKSIEQASEIVRQR